jgi:hypothetical protein
LPVIEPILRKLDRAQQILLRATDAIPADLWKTSPRQGRWSAAELIAHIMTVERAVVGTADRILKKQPKQIPLLKRFRLPFALALVEMRLLRMKTPIPVDPQLLDEREAMLATEGGPGPHARSNGGNPEPQSEPLSVAASFSRLTQCVRMVFIPRVTPDTARKTDARNCSQPVSR